MELIVVDTSALLAIMLDEPERAEFLAAVRAAERALISAVAVLEAGIVLRFRRGPTGPEDVLDIVSSMGIEIIPFDAPAATLALDAFGRYGKGLHSTARLNFGDCAAYALAKGMNAPLLFKGNDFAATDIISAQT